MESSGASFQGSIWKTHHIVFRIGINLTLSNTLLSKYFWNVDNGCVDSTTAEIKRQVLRIADPQKDPSYIRRKNLKQH